MLKIQKANHILSPQHTSLMHVFKIHVKFLRLKSVFRTFLACNFYKNELILENYTPQKNKVFHEGVLE